MPAATTNPSSLPHPTRYWYPHLGIYTASLLLGNDYDGSQGLVIVIFDANAKALKESEDHSMYLLAF